MLHANENGKAVPDMSDRSEANRSCKGCGESYRVTEAQIRRALASLQTEPERCVPDEVYRERLAICRACDKLQSGITCSACGCIIQIAAKLRERSCPLPGTGLWPPLDNDPADPALIR